MKSVKLFYLENCPHCRKTKRDLDELLSDSRFSAVKIEWIEESKNTELADQYDYYYVPCFYVNETKVKEGALSKEDVLDVLMMALK